MSKKPICLIDFDDVVAKCNDKVIECINRDYGTNYSISDLDNWGPTGDAILDNRFKYYSDPEWVEAQPIYEGAVEFIEKLKKLCEIVFCTAVSPNCMSVRAKAIQDNFGIDSNHIIMTSMKELVNSDFQLDDSPINISKSISKHPVLFRRPWNYDISGVMSISSYDEFLTFVEYVINPQPFDSIPANCILCLVGPSGSGKTEIMNEVIVKTDFQKVPTYTTSDKKNYTKLSLSEFDERVKNNFFAETTVYAGEKYGISNETVSYMSEYKDNRFIFATDMCGAMAMKNIFGQRVVIVFVKADKITLYTNILRKGLSERETVLRQISVDIEQSNRKFTDITIRSADDLFNLI